MKHLKRFMNDNWNGIMIENNTPLKHIPNLMVRHMIFQILAWMWCIIFSAIIGSFVVFGISLLQNINDLIFFNENLFYRRIQKPSY